MIIHTNVTCFSFSVMHLKKKNLTLSLLNITAQEAATEIQQREKVR